ncbi:Transcription activator protein acu-15 [Fusarium oxysporum f. sp. albedinis]|nr:Transcription activator protein acu-15 [Fusarium oxysporum f. sp. albedinis]
MPTHQLSKDTKDSDKVVKNRDRADEAHVRPFDTLMTLEPIDKQESGENSWTHDADLGIGGDNRRTDVE